MTDITVIQTGHFAFEEWSIRDGDQNAHYSVTFRGLNAKERAKAEAQRMRDALPKLRFVVEEANNTIRERRTDAWVVSWATPAASMFPGLVQHICDWLNEQSS